MLYNGYIHTQLIRKWATFRFNVPPPFKKASKIICWPLDTLKVCCSLFGNTKYSHNLSVILAAEVKMIFILEWRKWAAHQQISTNTYLLFSMKHFANFLCHSLHYQILYVLFASPRRSNIPGPWRKMCKYRNNYTQKTALVCCAVCVLVYMIVVENTVFVHRPSGHKKYRPL